MDQSSSPLVPGAIAVLADGPSATLERAIGSGAAFGRVVVLDRSLTGRGELVGAEVIGLDWTDDPTVERWAESEGLHWLAVIGADEELLGVDHTALATAAATGPVVALATDAGDENRIVRPGSSLAAIGQPAPARPDIVVRRQLCGRPDVSVIIPTFGRPRLLPRAVMAALSQRSVSVEVIVVNDGGPPPWSALGPLADGPSGPTVRCIDAPQNRGLGGARNLGLEAVRGRSVLLFDDDDVIHPDHLATLVASRGAQPAVRSGAVMVHVDESGREVARMLRDTPPLDHRRLLVRNEIVVHTALIDTAALVAVGGARDDLEVLEDWEMWLRLSARGEIGTIDWFGAEYHLRAGANSNVITRSALAQFETLGRIYGLHPTDDRSVLAARQQCLAEHRTLADQAGPPWPLVVGVLGAPDPARTADLVVVARRDAVPGTRVIIHQPDHPDVAAVLAELDATLCIDRTGDRDHAVRRLHAQALGAPLKILDAGFPDTTSGAAPTPIGASR